MLHGTISPPMSRTQELLSNIKSIQDRIDAASERGGRDPANVKLLIVTKKRAVEDLQALYDQEFRYWGESYTEEILQRFQQMPQDDLQWHFIGHLHRKHVNKIVGKVEMIHSVANQKLLEKIDNNAKGKNILQKICLEVNVSGEEQKQGFTPDQVRELYISGLMDGIGYASVQGLMTMAPFTEDEQVIRQTFQGLRDLRDELNDQYAAALFELSMGMSNDYELAVEEGATIVRVGTAIFI